MIFRTSGPSGPLTITVVGTGVPPMGDAEYVQVPSVLTVSTVSTLARFGIRLFLQLVTNLS